MIDEMHYKYNHKSIILLNMSLILRRFELSFACAFWMDRRIVSNFRLKPKI